MGIKKLNYNNAKTIFDIAEMVSEITGNQFAEKHRSMLENRLKKRALDLNLMNIDNYINYFNTHKDAEIKTLVSVLTTHHTFFFREFIHFEYLEEKAIPELIPIVRSRPDKKLKVWCAAASKGHEVYSLAMFLNVVLDRMAPDLTFEVFGSDIDPESINIGKNGVYTRKETKEIPLLYLADHWAKGTGEIADFVKAKNSLRSKTRWEVMNLLDIAKSFSEKFDIIFCRNVFIYFSPSQIEQSCTNLLDHLNPHGFFFVGTSESITSLNLPITTVGPSTYRKASYLKLKIDTVSLKKEGTANTAKTILSAKNVPLKNLNNFPASKNAAIANSNTSTSNPKNSTISGNSPNSANSTVSINPAAAENTYIKEKLKVLCVDDSPSILTLLKKVFSIDESFEVVGTAGNGIEAALKIKELQPDVITLDIHMPEQTGIEYLQKNFNSNHPPVVMVSSVSREESELALKALNLGASDYVEKPALSNMETVGDELKRKLRSAYRNRQFYQNRKVLSLDESFKKHVIINKPENFLRIVFGQMSDKKRINEFIKELGSNQPPTLVIVEAKNLDAKHIQNDFNFAHVYISEKPKEALKANKIYIASSENFNTIIDSKTKNIPTSILIFGETSRQNIDFFKNWDSAQILAEDLGPKRNSQNPLLSMNSDIVPTTSFAYMSCEFLGRKSK